MKKNILFFLPVFIRGGAGNAIFKMCKRFNKSKYNLYIISIGPCSYKRELKKYIKKFYELKTNRAIYSIFALRKIVNNLNLNKSIFVSNINYANVITILALRKYHGLKIILSERTAIKELDIYFGIKDFFKKKITKFLVKFLYKKANVVIANSKKTSDNLKNLCKIKVETIYSPAFVRFNKKIKKRNAIKKLLTVGRLSKEKDYETLIHAINLIKNQDFVLDILGEGEHKNKLTKLINRFNLKDKIFLRGYKKRPEEYFKKADLYINCSLFEGFPNSVIEAIGFNIPVICSKSHGGINEILSNGKGGYFFDSGNHEELANLISKFLSNQKKFEQKTNYARKTISKFNTLNSVKRYEKIFKKL